MQGNLKDKKRGLSKKGENVMPAVEKVQNIGFGKKTCNKKSMSGENSGLEKEKSWPMGVMSRKKRGGGVSSEKLGLGEDSRSGRDFQRG